MLSLINCTNTSSYACQPSCTLRVSVQQRSCVCPGQTSHRPKLKGKIQDVASHLKSHYKSSSDVPDLILTLWRKIRKYLIKINPWCYIIWLFLQIKLTSCFHCTPDPSSSTRKMLYHIPRTFNGERKKYVENISQYSWDTWQVMRAFYTKKYPNLDSWQEVNGICMSPVQQLGFSR